MAHPFMRIFERALRKSSPEENEVAKEAAKLIEKGYARTEVMDVLTRLKGSLLDDGEEMIVAEALETLGEE